MVILWYCEDARHELCVCCKNMSLKAHSWFTDTLLYSAFWKKIAKDENVGENSDKYKIKTKFADLHCVVGVLEVTGWKQTLNITKLDVAVTVKSGINIESLWLGVLIFEPENVESWEDMILFARGLPPSSEPPPCTFPELEVAETISSTQITLTHNLRSPSREFPP